LKGYDGWEMVLYEELEKSNSGPGDQTAEYRIIEAARERLVAREAWIDSGIATSCHIDPNQLNLFNRDIVGF
jgi:hypothetical protein